MKNKEKAIAAMRDFLEAVGVDLNDRDMEKTPERVAALFDYLFSGMDKKPEEIWGELFDVESDGIVAVRNIPFHSICEHHLLPFFGSVSIAYIPKNGRVAGFGKFTKLVECISHQPQLQERLTSMIAQEIEKGLDAEGVLVVVEAHQLCMAMHGEIANDTSTITSKSLGVFQEDSLLCRQAMKLLDKNEL